MLISAEDEALLGAKVTGLDERPWAEWQARLRRYVHCSEGHFYRGWAERALPWLLEGERHVLHTDRGDLPFSLASETEQHKLPRRELFAEGELLAQQEELTVKRKDGIMYVKIDHFLSAKTVDMACRLLREGQPQGVVLDIRDNMGGMTAYAAKLVGLFFAGDFSGCRKWTRKSSAVDIAAASQEAGMPMERVERYIADGLMTREEYEASRRIFSNCDFEYYQDQYAGTGELAGVPCALLTSRDTFSAAEDFTAFFKSNGRAKLVGTATYGSSGTPMIVHRQGIFARVCSVGYQLLDGSEFINHGIPADIPAVDEDLEEKALLALQ